MMRTNSLKELLLFQKTAKLECQQILEEISSLGDKISADEKIEVEKLKHEIHLRNSFISQIEDLI